jgi:mono/diheme cytochrome c family protein
MKLVKNVTLAFSFAVAGTLLAAPPKETPELIAKGKTSYTTNCALCHGEGGDVEKSPTGKAMKARHLVKDAYKAGDSPEKIFETITNGLKGTGMAAFAHIPEEDRWGIAYYVKSLRKSKK